MWPKRIFLLVPIVEVGETIAKIFANQGLYKDLKFALPSIVIKESRDRRLGVRGFRHKKNI